MYWLLSVIMNNQQPQWPQQQHIWPPTNQRWSLPQPANTPQRQFKGPLSLPSYTQQQYVQAQWGQHPPQYGGQPQQSSQSPLLQRPAHPHSPIPQSPSRHFKRWLWLTLGILTIVILFASIGVRPLASEGNTSSQLTPTSQVKQSSQSAQQAPTQPASQPTAISTPTHATTWTTTYTFTGSGEKKTTTFTVGNTWKIIWTCNPASIFGGLGAIVVNVFSSDGTFQHGAINDTCKSGHTAGDTIEQQGGNIYLDITGGGNWTIQVQELR